MKFPRARHLEPENEGASAEDRERWADAYKNAIIKERTRNGNVR